VQQQQGIEVPGHASREGRAGADRRGVAGVADGGGGGGRRPAKSLDGELEPAEGLVLEHGSQISILHKIE